MSGMSTLDCDARTPSFGPRAPKREPSENQAHFHICSRATEGLGFAVLTVDEECFFDFLF